jgi:uncharacterized membrane protein (UPF0136 family)
MRVVMKMCSVALVAIAAFLLYAVIHAAASAGGARVGVCIAYVVGALLLGFVAVRMWRRSEAPA